MSCPGHSSSMPTLASAEEEVSHKIEGPCLDLGGLPAGPLTNPNTIPPSASRRIEAKCSDTEMIPGEHIHHPRESALPA